ncbi:MAG TPA: 4'-phosphopantetheinyl transferase superfamily protein [Anaerolineales bacterium]|nr:4'-phosphopantetheinyl transferase superfamily protein [Anaerolineales bacterium]
MMETHNHFWSPAPTDLTLAGHEVHVWRAQLELPSSQVQRLRGFLTEDELDRANRFSFEIDRQRFIAARGTLRSILSRYLTIFPGHLRFHYNQYGKPFLASECSSQLLNFNLSHSGSVALYALTRNMDVGVDVERVRSGFAYEDIAERFFSANEVAILRTIPTEKKLEAFYTCWTRKEAYIKAHGKGLCLPLDSFDVSFAPWESPMLLITKDEPQESSHWTLLDLKPGLGYMGALAVKGIGCRFRYWEWNQS